MPSLLHFSILLTTTLLISVHNLKLHPHFQSFNVTYTDLKSSINSPIDYKYYDNLNSPLSNYYYGSITKQSYQMRIKLYKMDDYQMCGIGTPYATLDMQSCKVCPNDKPLFNLGTRQCQRCREHVTEKCDKLLNVMKNNTNLSTGSTINNIKTNNSTTNQTTNNNNILSNTTILSGNTSTSTTPSQITVSNLSPHVVTWQPKKNITTSTISTTQIPPPPPTIIQLLPVGENNKPISQQNITTPLSQYPIKQNTTNLTTTSSINPANLIASTTKKQNITFFAQQCPISTPFYNINTKICEQCKQNQEYVPLKKKCLPIIYISNEKYKNVILKSTDQLIEKNKKIKIDNLDRVVRECMIDRPMVVNGTCIKCGQNEIFNFTKQQCQNGCPDGKIFSQLQANCINATFITNPDAQKLLSPITDFEVFRSEQKNKEASSSVIVYCPIERPFNIAGKCAQCPSDNPLFNIESQRCQNCSRNRNYDSFQRKCVSEFEPGLQVVKIVPNIF